MCLDICVLHVCVYIDIRNEVSIRVSRLDNLTVKACISIVLLLVAGHLEASRGTLQPDPCSASHDVGKKSSGKSEPRGQAVSFCVGAVNAEAFRFISSALVLCRQAAALHEVQLHASTFTAAFLIGVHKYIGIAEPCHSVRTDRCTQVPCHVWGC